MLQHCLVLCLTTFLIATRLAALAAEVDTGKSAGQGHTGPWWMQQTALTRDGKLAISLQDRPWWSRALGLQVGESFIIEDPGLPRSAMLVRRESFKNRSNETVEALVWIIDDDEDGSLSTGGDSDSDCYLADYAGDGILDRVVDYIDDDGDGDPDEMDIRYFVAGSLRNAWFGIDLDDDSAMWSLAGYEYGGPSYFESDPYGDNIFYMNKIDPNQGIWIPISECPFSFHDTDGDGYSEVVVRVSAVPLEYDREKYPDYANYQGSSAWRKEQERMGVVNVRYSFDIDNLSSLKSPLHYDFGFNLVGGIPYEFEGMEHFNLKRRPPQVTRFIPHEKIREVSDSFPARETGFSWHEHYDDTISIGYGPTKDQDLRWEGIFWIWERRFMENTGAPNQKWNVRREWTQRPTKRRELYYSGIDRRIHLKGAKEGWMEMGHLGGQGVIGEVRMLDSNDNGFFDRWEVYLGNEPTPARVSTVQDEKVRLLQFDLQALGDFYTKEVLPEAMDSNRCLLNAMARVHKFNAPEGLKKALKEGSDNVRRYVQDVIRELHYQSLRSELVGSAHEVLRNAELNDLFSQRQNPPNTETAWRVIRLLQDLDVAYGNGDFDVAIVHLEKLAEAMDTKGAAAP